MDKELIKKYKEIVKNLPPMSSMSPRVMKNVFLLFQGLFMYTSGSLKDGPKDDFRYDGEYNHSRQCHRKSIEKEFLIERNPPMKLPEKLGRERAFVATFEYAYDNNINNPQKKVLKEFITAPTTYEGKVLVGIRITNRYPNVNIISIEEK